MAGVVGTAFVEVVPLTGKFGTALQTQMLGFAKKAGAAVGLALGADQLIQFFGDAISEAEQARKVMAQTNAVIESTGGVAGISAKELVKLSDSISKNVGVDDELIQSGGNLLLTFRSIANQAGAGNKIFDRALKVSVDLAEAFDQDLRGSVIQVGKALEDPIRGLTALRRVGVQFTEDQENMIKMLVASGDVLGAQKIILGELETQVGGSAAAVKTASDEFGVAFANMQESVGKHLLPIKDQLAELGTEFLKAFQTGGFAQGVELWKQKISQLPDALRIPLEFMTGQIEAFVQFFQGFVDVIGGIIQGDWGRIWEGLQQMFGGVWNGIIATLSATLQIIQSMLSVAWGLIQSAASAAWQGIVAAIQAIWNLLPSWLQETLTIIGQIMAMSWQGIVSIVSAAMSVITSVIQVGWSIISSVVQTAMSVISAVVSTGWSIISAIVSTAMSVIGSVISAGWSMITSIISAGMSVITSVISAGWSIVQGVTSAAWGAITSIISGAIGAISGLISGLIGIINTLSGAFSAIASAASSAWGTVQSVVGGAVSAIMGPISSLASALGSVVGVLQNIAGAARSAASAISSIPSSIPGAGLLGRLPGIGGLFRAMGGPVSAHMPYIVGERGPELFVPGRSGAIVPNFALPQATRVGDSGIAQLLREQNAILRAIAANQRSAPSRTASRSVLQPRA